MKKVLLPRASPVSVGDLNLFFVTFNFSFWLVKFSLLQFSFCVLLICLIIYCDCIAFLETTLSFSFFKKFSS